MCTQNHCIHVSCQMQEEKGDEVDDLSSFEKVFLDKGSWKSPIIISFQSHLDPLLPKNPSFVIRSSSIEDRKSSLNLISVLLSLYSSISILHA